MAVLTLLLLLFAASAVAADEGDLLFSDACVLYICIYIFFSSFTLLTVFDFGISLFD
jgi:hypothetical protein